MRTVSVFFGWPSGGVWSNLVAALLWGTPAFIGQHVLLRRHHAATTAKQTEELKAHIDRKLGGPQQ